MYKLIKTFTRVNAEAMIVSSYMSYAVADYYMKLYNSYAKKYGLGFLCKVTK